MCYNCKASSGCGCAGGSVFAFCPCEKGYYCSVCGHSAGTNVAAEPDLLSKIIRPEILKSAGQSKK